LAPHLCCCLLSPYWHLFIFRSASDKSIVDFPLQNVYRTSHW
jgi:hypothetical protein